MKNRNLRSIAAALMIATWGSAVSADIIRNGDFENPDDPRSSAQNQNGVLGIDFDHWEETGPGGTASFDTDPYTGTGQAPRFGNGLSVLYQDLGYNWSSSETYDLSFNASETSWRTSATDTLTVSLLQTNGTVLWTTTINVDVYAAGSWSTAQTFDYSIDASTFSTGSEGEELRIEFRDSGVLWLDNVAFVVPEPGSLALLGLGGLLIARRRRG